MGDNSFHIENDRLESFYENADRFADEDFARQERKGDDLIESTRLSMDFPKQAVEALSKIADDKGFPLQEMSDKEILSIGVFLHNVGELFSHKESPKKLSEEIANMDESALKSFYKEVLRPESEFGDEYNIIKDKEDRKHIAEFVYQTVEENNYFIINKVLNKPIHFLGENETLPPDAFKLIKPHSEDAVRDTLLTYIYEKTENPSKKALLRRAFSNPITISPLYTRYSGAGLPKNGAFKYLYNNL